MGHWERHLTCCIVKQSTWLWRAKTTLKTTNSLKSWWFMQAGRSALGLLLESGQAAQAHGPFSLWVMELMVGPGAGWSRAGRSTSLNPPAREKWLIHYVFLGPLYYTLMDQYRNIRGSSVCTLSSPHFGGQISQTSFKCYSEEPPID